MKKQQCNIWTRREWSFNYIFISKPTCDKPKAEGRRPESERSERASEASSTRAKCIRLGVYSSQTVHLPEATKCNSLGVYPSRSVQLPGAQYKFSRSGYVQSTIQIQQKRICAKDQMEFKIPLNRNLQTYRQYKFSRSGYVQRIKWNLRHP